GEGFPVALLEYVAGIEAASLLNALDEALAAGVLREVGEGYQFTHALIRRTLYEEQNLPRRQRSHARAAVAIEEARAVGRSRAGTDLQALAMHERLAGPLVDADKAFVHARQAAEAAAAAFAWETAAARYRAALDLHDPADESGRCELLLALGQAENRSGELVAAGQSFRRAAELARRRGQPLALARAAWGQAEYFGAGVVG